MVSTVWRSVEKPECIPLGGCIGADECAYCGEPIDPPDVITEDPTGRFELRKSSEDV